MATKKILFHCLCLLSRLIKKDTFEGEKANNTTPDLNTQTLLSDSARVDVEVYWMKYFT